MSEIPLPYDGVVFAGGGCRCFWQVGFCQALGDRLRPSEVAAASAGAAMASVVLAGIGKRAVEAFRETARQTDRNFDLRRVLRGSSPFPHAELFQNTVLTCVDSTAMTKLQSGPPLYVSLTRPPPLPLPLPRPLPSSPPPPLSLSLRETNR